MRRRSIRFRLTLWYAAALSLGLGLFGGLVWFSLRARLIGDIDRDLADRAARFERYFRAESADETHAQLLDELDEFCQALPESSVVAVRNAAGVVFQYPSSGTRVPPANLRLLRTTFTYAGETYQLENGTSIASVTHTLDLLAILLLSLIPAMIAIACAGGAWLGARAMRPVEDITRAAHAISIENLAGRLPEPGTGDEIAHLSRVLNGMLARLEAAVRTLAQFAADASHELRTPLSVIRTSAELALRRPRSAEEYRASLQEVAAEAERMTRLVEDLLALARNDTHAAEMPLAPLDLRAIAGEVCGEMRRLAEVRGIRVVASLDRDPAVIAGNRAALHRLMVVLLDNAIKFSADASEVRVEVRRADSNSESIMLSVEDFGSGIAAGDLPHIFKRFYRADGARAGDGFGLGLALAESIARAHGASIVVRSGVARSSENAANPGKRGPCGSTMFEVTFPGREIRGDFAEAKDRSMSPSEAAG